MRLLSFRCDGHDRVGVLGRDSQVIDLSLAAPGLPRDLIAILRSGSESLGLIARAVDSHSPADELSLAGLVLRAPITEPQKIICVGLNYRDHAEESKLPLPEFPVIFAKYPNCLIGSGEPIILPPLSQQVDYEGELAVVIGRRGKDIPESDALRFVAGYSAFNDVSARDFQHRTSQWSIGKSFDGFGPMGPVLVTAGEIGDPQDLDIRVSIGDQVLQSSNTRNMIFSVARLVSELSQVMTLEPGDMIATGTPGGVGAARTPPRFLQAGDVVRVEIAGIGILENPVVAQS